MSSKLAYRCRYYDDDGAPSLTGGCKRSEMNTTTCLFVHPWEPEWSRTTKRGRFDNLNTESSDMDMVEDRGRFRRKGKGKERERDTFDNRNRPTDTGWNRRPHNISSPGDKSLPLAPEAMRDGFDRSAWGADSEPSGSQASTSAANHNQVLDVIMDPPVADRATTGWGASPVTGGWGWADNNAFQTVHDTNPNWATTNNMGQNSQSNTDPPTPIAEPPPSVYWSTQPTAAPTPVPKPAPRFALPGRSKLIPAVPKNIEPPLILNIPTNPLELSYEQRINLFDTQMRLMISVIRLKIQLNEAKAAIAKWEDSALGDSFKNIRIRGREKVVQLQNELSTQHEALLTQYTKEEKRLINHPDVSFQSTDLDISAITSQSSTFQSELGKYIANLKAEIADMEKEPEEPSLESKSKPAEDVAAVRMKEFCSSLLTFEEQLSDLASDIWGKTIDEDGTRNEQLNWIVDTGVKKADIISKKKEKILEKEVVQILKQADEKVDSFDDLVAERAERTTSLISDTNKTRIALLVEGKMLAANLNLKNQLMAQLAEIERTQEERHTEIMKLQKTVENLHEHRQVVRHPTFDGQFHDTELRDWVRDLTDRELEPFVDVLLQKGFMEFNRRTIQPLHQYLDSIHSTTVGVHTVAKAKTLPTAS